MSAELKPQADGEPCAFCHAPLAADQRYCLQCGTRRADARLEFAEVLVSEAALTSPRPPGLAAARTQSFDIGESSASAPGGGGVNGWLQRQSGILGLAGLLLGTLLVGLLLGHWATSGGHDDTVKAAPAQVIRVGGGSADTADTATDDTAATASTSKKHHKKSKAQAAEDAADAKAAAAKPVQSVATVNKLQGKAKDKALSDIAKKGGGLSTGGGKLPPKDNKAAGGGSTFEDIG